MSSKITKRQAARKAESRRQLKQAYLFVVANWAVGAGEVAADLGVEVKRARALLNTLRTKHLVESMHVNGEREVTWQSYYNTQDYDAAEELAKAEEDFNATFPEGSEPKAGPANPATGSRYTEEQLAAGKASREQGANWERVAADVGVKAASHFSKAVRAAYPEVK